MYFLTWYNDRSCTSTYFSGRKALKAYTSFWLLSGLESVYLKTFITPRFERVYCDTVSIVLNWLWGDKYLNKS